MRFAVDAAPRRMPNGLLAPVGGRLLVVDDRLRVEAPAGAVPPAIVEAIRTNKATLLSEIRERQQMCFGIVSHAIETVAGQYRTGCIEALCPEERQAIARTESALNAAAAAGDVHATDGCADAFIAAWNRVLALHALALEILGLTVDEWCTRPDKPTIVLNTNHGEVLFVADRDAYARAVETGQVVFSPLEVEQLASAQQREVANEDFVRTLIETKRAFPGARIEDVRPSGVDREDPDPPITKTSKGGTSDANRTT